MANLLQSSQTQATQAPSFYTNYLGNVASKATNMLPGGACSPQYVCAQPLQTKAFQSACSTAGTYQPFVQTGAGLIGCASKQDITGAAAPYLQAGTTASPLCAAKPLICKTANLNLACLAGQYMSPYVCYAVQNMSDIAMRNIRQNLSPQATAAAVGSGQFGSQRGAQVLGQVEANALQDLNSQIANMLNTGYGQALNAATAKQGALGQLAQTTSAAQQAQNQANLTAGQTAASAATQEANALQQAGLGMGTLGSQGQNINLACINALATLGGQQQTIAQNKQMFPLSTLSNLASILQGYSIPTSTTTTLCMSPLSGAAAIGAGTLGVLQKCKTTGLSPLESAYQTIQGWLPTKSTDTGVATGGNTTGAGTTTDYGAGLQGQPFTTVYDENNNPLGYYDQNGNFVKSGTYSCGCASLGYIKDGGSIQAKASGGVIGCKSTRHRGGLAG
jgi:hypothetical protein